MATTTILVGTVGQGIMRSGDDGATWQRVGIGQGMHSDAMVRTLLNHPRRPEIILCWHREGTVSQRRRWGEVATIDSPLRTMPSGRLPVTL